MEICGTVLPVNKERELPSGPYSACFEALITAAVVTELKKQSAGACLLCAMDYWAEKDWE